MSDEDELRCWRDSQARSTAAQEGRLTEAGVVFLVAQPDGEKVRFLPGSKTGSRNTGVGQEQGGR